MKQDVNSILIANYYLVKCKLDNNCCDKVEIARKYLTSIIKKALIDRTKTLSTKAISIL